MSSEIYLNRFKKSPTEKTAILSDLLKVAKRQADALNEQVEVNLSSDQTEFRVELKSGTLTISEDHGSFSWENTTVDIPFSLLFETAKAGDMAMVLEGGEYAVILTTDSQRAALPKGWISDESEVSICRSSPELAKLLDSWMQIQRRYTRDLRANRASQVSPSLSGWDPTGTRRFIYVQARERETALKQLREAASYYRKSLRNGTVTASKNGTLGGTGLKLKTPAGEVFFALRITGDIENWTAVLNSFASLGGRLTGVLRSPETLSLSDGRILSLAECVVTSGQE
jgi:hypothetical protein